MGPVLVSLQMPPHELQPLWLRVNVIRDCLFYSEICFPFLASVNFCPQHSWMLLSTLKLNSVGDWRVQMSQSSQPSVRIRCGPKCFKVTAMTELEKSNFPKQSFNFKMINYHDTWCVSHVLMHLVLQLQCVVNNASAWNSFSAFLFTNCSD